MLIKLLLILLHSIALSSAEEIKMAHRYFRFSIELKENQILYKAPYTELSLLKNECNDYLLDEMSKKIESLKKSLATKSSEEDYVEVTIGGDKKYLNKNEKDFEYFKNFDQNFKLIKIEEKMLKCAKDKK